MFVSPFVCAISLSSNSIPGFLEQNLKICFTVEIASITRMHSSRMRTACSSSRLLGGGVSASVHAGIPPPLGVGLETPWVWAWRTPWVWAWRPPWCGPGAPQARPLDFPLGVSLETYKAYWDTIPPETCKAC